MSVGAFVRLPQPLPIVETASREVDSIINVIHASLNAAEPPETEAAKGLGSRLTPYFSKEIFDVGEVVWDDDVVDAMSRQDRAKIKADADLQYRQAMCRKQWSNLVIEELAGEEAGRAALRQALGSDLKDPKPILAALLKDATQNDLQAIADAVPISIGFPLATFPIQAKLILEPTFERMFFEENIPLEIRACGVIAVHAIGKWIDESLWMKTAVDLLDDRFAQFGKRFLARFEDSPRLREALLSNPIPSSDWIELSTQFDDPVFFEMYCDFVLQSSLADSDIITCLKASKHPQSFDTLVAIVDELVNSETSKSRTKRFQDTLKVVATKLGKKVPKTTKKSTVSLMPAPAWEPAEEFHAPNFGDFDHIFSEVKIAFENAGLNAYFSAAVRVATALTPERWEDVALGQSRFGGILICPLNSRGPNTRGLR